MTRFDSILKAITRSQKTEEGYVTVVLGETQNISKINISYPEAGSRDFAALKEYVGSRLGNARHVISEQIILSVINLILDLSENSPNPTRRMDEFLNSFCKAKVKMVYSSKAKGQIKDIFFGNFRMGVLEWEEFSQLIITQTQSDFHTRYQKALIDTIVVEHKPTDIIVLNTGEYSAKVNHRNNFNLDYYFESIRLILFKRFLDDLDKQSKLLTGLMGVFFDPDILLTFLGGESIAIFYRIKGEKGLGWVNAGAYRVNQINLQSFREIDDAQKLLARIEEAIALNNVFSSLIKLLTQFMSDAEMLAYKRRWNEAFMNFMVGLDAIFNLDNELSSSFVLKKRVSVIVSLFEAKVYQEQFNLLTLLYIKRSEFVHAGKAIDETAVKQIRHICRAVVSVLISVCSKQDISVDQWLKNLDLAGDQLHRQLPIDKTLRASCGVE